VDGPDDSILDQIDGRPVGPVGPALQPPPPVAPPLPERPEPIPAERQPDGSYSDPITEWTDWTRDAARRLQEHLTRAATFRGQLDCGGWNDEVTNARSLMEALFRGRYRQGGALELQVSDFYRPFIEREAAQPCEWASPEDETAYRVLLEQRAAGEFDDFYAELLFGAGANEVPLANYGFEHDGVGTDERPAAFSEHRIQMYEIVLGARFDRLELSLGYAEGDASNRSELPVSTAGGAQGTVNTAPAPSGSTGAAANRGLTVDTHTEVREFSGSARYEILDFGEAGSDPLESPRANSRVSAGLIGELFVDYREREHFGEVEIPGVPAGTPPVIAQALEQDVDELAIGAALGVEALIPLGGGAGVRFGVDLGLYYFDHELDSLQTNEQLVGPPEDRAFDIALEDGESGIGATTAVRGEFILDVSGRPVDGNARGGVEIFAGAEGRFMSERAQVNNPFSGDFVLAGGTTFLGTADTFDWRVFAGVRIPFGGR
jgi:hypothetical protein